MDENTVAKSLDEAIAEEPSGASADETVVETKADSKESGKSEGKGESKSVPYDRFAEVNSNWRETQKALEAKDAELAKQRDAVSKLTDLLEAKEQDARYVESIRDLYRSDPTWKESLEKLERRLAGVEEEVESGEKTEKEGEAETKRLLKQTQEALEEQILDQRSTMIVNQANQYAAELLERLPEEYSDLDKERISVIWTDAVDWAKVESSDDWNSALVDELQSSLDHVLNNVYKEPQGVLIQRVRDELGLENKEETVQQTPQERLSSIINKDWGAVKEVQDKEGKTKLSSAYTDDQFAAAMAEALREGRKVEAEARKK